MTGGALPTGTVTFLFTDIEGSTRIGDALGAEAYSRLLERHRTLLREAFAAHGGIEVGTEGDSFFVVFDHPTSALSAAADAQQSLAAEAWPEDAAIRVRIGAHTGEGVLIDGTYVGPDVNRAARIAGAGHGGQVLVSATTSTLARDLPAGLSLQTLGEHRLRDLRPETLCQLEIEGLRTSFPPIRSLDARPNNLPNQLTTFIGREQELADAADLLAGARLLTLTGPGGTGKTRLALQLAATVGEGYPDGTFFVALEPVRDPALVVPRILSAIGLVESGSRSLMDTLVDWLEPRRVLLVLDNFEQVIDAAPIVADLLRAATTLCVIVTSRAPLHVSGEQEYAVPGLPTPPDPSQLSGFERARLGSADLILDPTILETYEAVRLFISRAIAVRPDFRVTNENAPAVAAICARLHGMPLAIELAAARIKILAPEAILARLEHQLSLLASGARDLPPRQQTLRGAIAWSYDILDDGLRRLLDRLSVFVGGCEFETAEAICGPADELGLDVLDGLMALADHSLIRANDTLGTTRFELLDTIREYAGEQLEARGEGAEIRVRHGAAFLALAEEAAPHLAGDDQRGWLDRLEREHDNIRAALDHAVASGDGARAVPLAFAMWRFWQKRGHLPEARRRLDLIAGQPWAREDPVRWARLMEALGGIAWWQADLAAMGGFYQEALRVWRELGDKREIANALYNASFAWVVGEPGSGPAVDPDGVGLQHMEEARALFAEVGDERGVANTLWAIGNYHYFRAEGDHGTDNFRQALEILRRVGDRTMEAWSLHMLGSALLRLGNVEEAREACRHALQHFHEAGDAAGMTLLLDDLSAIAVADGDLPRGARIRGAARSLSTQTGTGLAGWIEDHYELGVRPSAREVMSREELERYSMEGARWSLDEAVAYALGVTVDDLATPIGSH